MVFEDWRLISQDDEKINWKFEGKMQMKEIGLISSAIGIANG
jgi:hypothetical protein